MRRQRSKLFEKRFPIGDAENRFRVSLSRINPESGEEEWAIAGRVTVAREIGSNATAGYEVKLARPGAIPISFSSAKTIAALNGAKAREVTLSADELSGADAIIVEQNTSTDSGEFVMVQVRLEFGQ